MRRRLLRAAAMLVAGASGVTRAQTASPMWMDAEGAQATPTTPQAFGTLIGNEISRWKPVVDRARIKPK